LSSEPQAGQIPNGLRATGGNPRRLLPTNRVREANRLAQFGELADALARGFRVERLCGPRSATRSISQPGARSSAGRD